MCNLSGKLDFVHFPLADIPLPSAPCLTARNPGLLLNFQSVCFFLFTMWLWHVPEHMPYSVLSSDDNRLQKKLVL